MPKKHDVITKKRTKGVVYVLDPLLKTNTMVIIKLEREVL
jgi:hypothetical protein